MKVSMDVMNKHGIQMIKVKKYEKENEDIKDTTCCRVEKNTRFCCCFGVLGYCLNVSLFFNTTERFSLHNK